MKMKRLTALFLAAAMSISTAATALPVYAEDAPQPSSLTEEADAGTQADGGADDTQPEQQPQPGPGPEAGAGSTPASPQPSPESGQTTQPERQPAQPIQLPETQGDTAPAAGTPDPNEGLCPHHTEHDDTCGYKKAVDEQPCGHEHDDKCEFDGSEGSCTHEHDDTCGYVEAQPGSPCAFVCPVCDCTCTSLCTPEQRDPDCPVCQNDYKDCTFTTVEVSVWFSGDNYNGGHYAQCGAQNIFVSVQGTITGKKVTSAEVAVTLTQEELALLGDLSDRGLQLDGDKLKFTVDMNEQTGSGIFSASFNVRSDALATLDIADTDISVTLTPEEYQNSGLVGVSASGDRLTFVEKLPTQNDPYGGGLEYAAVVDELAVHYVDSEGNPAARQEDAPFFTLYYQVGDDEPQALDPEDRPFGMDDAPVIAAPADNTWTGSVADASRLPSRVLTWAGDAFQEQSVSWYLQPSYTVDNTNGTLVQITEDNKDQYPAGLAVGSWYFIANPEPFPDDVPEVIETLGNLHHTVYWADNGDAEGKRPDDMTGLYELQFSLDGSYQYQTLTVENMGTLGLKDLPQPTLTHDSGVWEVDWDNSLPSKVRYTDSTGFGDKPVVRSVSWRFVPKDGAAGYAMVEVNEENADQYPSAGEKYGTYFVLETSMDFYVRIYRGDNQGGHGLRDAFYDQFHLHAQYGDKKDLYFLLAQMLDDGHVRDDYDVDGKDPDCITVTVDGLWRYNLDNTRISYSIKEGEVTDAATEPAEGDGKVDSVAVPEEGDYFAIGYDNGEVPNYGDATDAVYGGGTVKLTLSGMRKWDATKVWLDDGKTTRPNTVFELWRYRADQPYSTASLVRDDSGLRLTIDPEPLEGDPNKYTLQIDDLPKYDAEGYAYLYVVREYLEGDNASRYEQVFGVVGEDGNVTDTVLPAGTERASGNTFLYRGGTLSNRLRGTVTVPVTKEWKAASFQSFFENVMVELRLQSRPAGSESEDEWQNTEYTDKIFGFFAENLAITHANSYPQYDGQGRELEYRWVEEAVWQEGRVQDGQYVDGDKVPVTEENGSKIFTLTQNGRKIQYRSVSREAEDGGTVITNSIANTIDYAVEKKFEGGWDADNYEERYTFTLFRSTSGSQAVRYLTFTMDGDAEGDVEFTTHNVDEEEKNITVQRDGAWKVSIHGLPEFDTEGQQYEYMLLEKSGNLLSIQTERDDEGNYASVITNGPGDTNLILVRKEWIDESDSEHRLPVTVTVYDKETCEPLTVDGHGVSATLKNNGTGWYAILNIGTYEPNEVYVLETAVGKSQVTENPDSAPNYTNDGDTTYTQAWVDTDYHKYEVTYAYEKSFGGDGSAFAGVPCFTVTNRRLGNVDITVTKNWVDGDGDKRTALADALQTAGIQLAVRLDFLSEESPEQDYTITRSGYGDDTQGDTVTISPGNTVHIEGNNSGSWVDSIQVLDLRASEQKTQTLYFWNLPKYDGNGAVVRYTVEEIFVNEKGVEVSEAKLPPEVAAAWQDYQATVTAEEYEVGHLHADDRQDFTIQNALSGTTTASWYTLWQDQYAYDEGYRPDIYLNIYARTHVQGEDGATTRTELVVPNYRWEYDGKTEEEGISESTFWKCTIENLPKYDELGYEIDYFALMSSSVSAEDFGYLNSQYAPNRATDGSGAFGTSDGVDEGASDEEKKLVQNVGKDGAPNYALQSGNTFINTLYGTISVRGEKLWQNLPDSYPMTDLPTVTFYLDRTAGDGPEEKDVASMTVTGDDWKNLLVNGQYVFAFGHTGANAPSSKIPWNGELPQGTALLPRFDTQGRLYTYTVREVIEWDGTAAGNAGGNVFTLDGSGQTLRNSYNPATAQLSAVKYLTVPQGLESYPAITLQLTRTYTTNDETPSESLTVQTQTWNAAEVKTAVAAATDTDGDGNVTIQHTFTFKNLPVYAPNGSEFVYTITEDKSSLGGYDTWAASGNKSVEELEKDAYKGATSVGDLRPDKDSGIDASFLNKPGDPGTITLTGDKVWQDLNNVFGFRPDELTLTLQRWANSQPGQSNPIGLQPVTLTEGQITWVKGDLNSWTYTITGLERYAPNGMPWIYQVIETVPEPYTASPANGTVTQKGGADQTTGNVTMNDLTNSILTSKNFRKTWVDSQGRTITQDILGDGIELEVKYALQVRAKAESAADSAYTDWRNASAYFTATLPEGDTSGLRDRAYTGSIRATLSDAKWKQSYYGENNSLQNLPLYIKGADGNVYELEYRVVETEVNVYPNSDSAAASLLKLTYTAPVDNGGGSYAYTVTEKIGAAQGFIKPYYGSANEIAQLNNTANHKNQLATTELTVQKMWVDDNNNAYGTRPATDADRYTWEVTLVIQRSTDGATWTDVQEVTLYGTDDLTQADQTVTGLPVMVVDADGNLTGCQYRVQELQPATDNAVEAGGAFHGGYTVAYPDNDGPLTAENTLEITRFTAQKIWNDNQNENEKRPTSITLELKYLKAGGDPAREEDYRSFAAPAIVTLDSTADGGSGKLYYEDAPWHAVWKDVPAVMPGSATDNGNTVYKVFESVSGDYIIESSPTTSAGGGNFTITNTPSITLSVDKIWLGLDAQTSVTVELRRTVDGGKPVVVKEVTLNEDNHWQHTFDPVPVYDGGGKKYQYTVAETEINGNPAEEFECGIAYGGNAESGFHIYNYQIGALYVVKDWADDALPEDRPDDLTLKLYRTTVQDPAESDWQEVTWLTYTWTKYGDRWVASFNDLAMVDANGNPYTYRVEEVCPYGYEQKREEILDEKTGELIGFYFKNTLSERINIPVRKVWVDNNDHFGWRPDSITVELYANGKRTDKTLTLGPNALQNLWNFVTGSANGWSGTFTGIPKYDQNGALIEYSVVETPVPDHYEVSYGQDADGTFVITNSAGGDLIVSKRVTGEGEDGSAQFHFTVQVSDDTLSGTFGDMTFTNGTASVTLRDGEQAAARGLPAGLSYTVTEAEADRGPYTTASTGEAGTIPAGGTATAEFTNDHRVISIPVEKIWQDDGDRDGLRPQSITVKLLADGADAGRRLTLDASCGWKGSFGGLDAYRDGKPVNYTVEEVPVEGYQAEVTGDAASGFVIINGRTGGTPAAGASGQSTPQAPQTGDGLDLSLLVTLNLLSLLGMAGLILGARRKKRAARK